jgi:hypothetical protein
METKHLIALLVSINISLVGWALIEIVDLRTSVAKLDMALFYRDSEQ